MTYTEFKAKKAEQSEVRKVAFANLRKELVASKASDSVLAQLDALSSDKVATAHKNWRERNLPSSRTYLLKLCVTGSNDTIINDDESIADFVDRLKTTEENLYIVRDESTVKRYLQFYAKKEGFAYHIADGYVIVD